MAILDFFKRKKAVVAKRGFQAAQYNRLVNDWVTSSASIDAELRGSLKTLRNRTRDLCKNNDYAKNALRAIENNVVGQGVRLQAQITQNNGRNSGKLNTRVNTAIEAAWAEWCKKDNCHTGGTLSFSDIERMLISSSAESGEVFVRLVRKKFGRSEIPFALEVIEADLLDEDHHEVLRNGREVRFGIERDEWQRPVAYWFKNKHPGDYTFTGTSDKGKIRVPAEDVIHLFKQTRPGQTRGFPWFAPAIVRMHHLHGFEEAEVIKARAQASIMGFIKSESDGLQDGVQDNQRVTNFEPGTIEHLLPGEDFTAFTPTSPGGQFEPFMRAMLRAVAAGIGVSYETLSRDYSQSNYSSSRLALLDDRDNWRTLQQWMIENFHQVVFEKWLDMAWASNQIDLPNYGGNEKMYRSYRFVARGWSWVDPVKEVNAYKDAVRSGFMTVSDVLAASGQDFDEMVAQRKREIDTTEELDLVFDTDAGKVAGNGQSTVVPDPAEPQESATQQEQESKFADVFAAETKGLRELVSGLAMKQVESNGMQNADIAQAAGALRSAAEQMVSMAKEGIKNSPIVINPPAITVEAKMPEVRVEAIMPATEQIAPVVNVYNDVQPSDVTVIDNHPSRAVQTVERNKDDEIIKTIINYEK